MMRSALTWAVLLLAPTLLFGQMTFQQDGFVEYRGFGFPQAASNDRAQVVGEARIHYDVLYGLAPGWTLSGGTETISDTHRQTEREFRLNIDDRGLKRPNFSIRRISVAYQRGPITIEAGKQLIRWGKTSILNPTDRFAPRDYLTVVENDVLAVTAARAVIGDSSDNLEVVVQPFFTPSRTPLSDQRWTMLPEAVRGIPAIDQGSRIPGGIQWGARWKHQGDNYDMSLSFFDGHNHLPILQLESNGLQVDFGRVFPQMRMYGGDVAVPFKWATFKAEAAYSTSTSKDADEYVLYVVQLERKFKKLEFTGGYAGEAVTAKRTQYNFAPDRGLARAFLGRGTYTIDPKRSAAFETAARADGLLLRSEYSEAWGAHWRGTVGFTLLRGEPTDFLGQYRRNSFFNVSLRYGF